MDVGGILISSGTERERKKKKRGGGKEDLGDLNNSRGEEGGERYRKFRRPFPGKWVEGCNRWGKREIGNSRKILCSTGPLFTSLSDSTSGEPERGRDSVRVPALLHQGGSDSDRLPGGQPAPRHPAGGDAHTQRALHVRELGGNRQAHAAGKERKHNFSRSDTSDTLYDSYYTVLPV